MNGQLWQEKIEDQIAAEELWERAVLEWYCTVSTMTTREAYKLAYRLARITEYSTAFDTGILFKGNHSEAYKWAYASCQLRHMGTDYKEMQRIWKKAVHNQFVSSAIFEFFASTTSFPAEF